MTTLDTYREYAENSIENFARRDAASRNLFVNAVADSEVKKVLDVGCGAGQELIPFAEKRGAFCVGVDLGKELGAVAKIFVEKTDFAEKVSFARSNGERLPFANASFDVVLCRVALPYMNNRTTLAEVGRVLRTGGVFLLKTHTPAFYFGMIKKRLRSLSVKQIAYPLICLAGGAYHSLTGKQLQKGFWAGKEVYQTERFLRRELAKNNLKITGFLSDTNIATPSFIIVKN